MKLMRMSVVPKKSQPPVLGRKLPGLPGLQVMGTMIDRIIATAQVGLAYGEPITLGDRTLIPVGAVGYGFGGGVGTGSSGGRFRRRKGKGTGGGGGGGVNIQPIALVEITKKGTKIRPVLDWTRIVVALAAVMVPVLLKARQQGKAAKKSEMQFALGGSA